MIEIVNFRTEHLKTMDLQEEQQYLHEWATEDVCRCLEDGWAYTALDDGVPLGCAGVVPMWEDRGMAWAYISKLATGQKFLHVHRGVKRFLDGCGLRRLEMTVDCDFEQGHRWAKMLGFTLEAERMRDYLPMGGDCSLYARVR